MSYAEVLQLIRKKDKISNIYSENISYQTNLINTTDKIAAGNLRYKPSVI